LQHKYRTKSYTEADYYHQKAQDPATNQRFVRKTQGHATKQLCVVYLRLSNTGTHRYPNTHHRGSSSDSGKTNRKNIKVLGNVASVRLNIAGNIASSLLGGADISSG
jgi:hypothetical protein